MKLFKLSSALIMALIASTYIAPAARANEADQLVVISNVKYNGYPVAFPQVQEKDIDSSLDLVCGIFGYSKIKTMKFDRFARNGNMPTYALVSKYGVEVSSASLEIPYYLTEITCIK